MLEEDATEPRTRSEHLVSWALELGFSRAGVAPLGAAPTGEAYLEWLERGDHAGMAYMDESREARLDGGATLEGARSAVCVALDYPAEESEGDLWPGVARYARGRDYHNVMGRKLRKLARRVREAYPGAATRTWVDAGPVLERDLHTRAGLGAIGKNTMLLHPEAGSLFLLGEVLTTLELEPGTPLGDPCGSCTLCLEACPTGALPEPYRLDARRCISYWTIEHRGAMPADVREWVGNWVFGCDVCQEACPHNEGPFELQPGRDSPFVVPESRRHLDLEALLGLDEEAYRELFRGSPMQRARLEGLRRNAATVMGNSGRRDYVSALAGALEAADPAGLHAAWALGRLGGEEALRAIDAALERRPSDPLRRELLQAREEVLKAP